MIGIQMRMRKYRAKKLLSDVIELHNIKKAYLDCMKIDIKVSKHDCIYPVGLNSQSVELPERFEIVAGKYVKHEYIKLTLGKDVLPCGIDMIYIRGDSLASYHTEQPESIWFRKLLSRLKYKRTLEKTKELFVKEVAEDVISILSHKTVKLALFDKLTQIHDECDLESVKALLNALHDGKDAGIHQLTDHLAKFYLDQESPSFLLVWHKLTSTLQKILENLKSANRSALELAHDPTKQLNNLTHSK